MGHAHVSYGPGPINFIDLHDRTAIIEAPNRFFRDWVKERYLKLMQQMLSTEVGSAVEISLTVRDEGERSKTANGQGSRNSHERPSQADAQGTVSASSRINQAERSLLHPELNPQFTFAEFVVGPSNQFAPASRRRPGASLPFTTIRLVEDFSPHGLLNMPSILPQHHGVAGQ
jgi:chromosomal replication initiator protein